MPSWRAYSTPCRSRAAAARAGCCRASADGAEVSTDAAAAAAAAGEAEWWLECAVAVVCWERLFGGGGGDLLAGCACAGARCDARTRRPRSAAVCTCWSWERACARRRVDTWLRHTRWAPTPVWDTCSGWTVRLTAFAFAIVVVGAVDVALNVAAGTDSRLPLSYCYYRPYYSVDAWCALRSRLRLRLRCSCERSDDHSRETHQSSRCSRDPAPPLPPLQSLVSIIRKCKFKFKYRSALIEFLSKTLDLHVRLEGSKMF